MTYSIELHCKFDSWKDFIETLAHEMVHLYQMTVIKDPYSNHNKNFYAFSEKFKTVGFLLTCQYIVSQTIYGTGYFFKFNYLCEPYTLILHLY